MAIGAIEATITSDLRQRSYRIQVVDDELIVSLPESSYTVNLQTRPSYSRGEYPWKTIREFP